MPENRVLLQAILQYPEQDEPRERYADWCAIQGDRPTHAREDFIRAQLALAKTSRFDNLERYLQLSANERRLLETYRDAWGESISEYVHSFEFNRGFVELIALSAREFRERAETLATMAPIAHLDITSMGDDAREFFASPHLERLHSLSLANCGLRDRDVELLAASPHLKRLRWLDLAYNQIGVDGAQALAQRARVNFPQLQHVRFFGNPFDPNERYAYDHNQIVDRWLPPPGVALEAEHGVLPWLHIAGDTIDDVVPNRFRLSSRT